MSPHDAILHRALAVANVIRGKVHAHGQGAAIAELQELIAGCRGELIALGPPGEAERYLDPVQKLASLMARDPTDTALVAQFDAAHADACAYLAGHAGAR